MKKMSRKLTLATDLKPTGREWSQLVESFFFLHFSMRIRHVAGRGMVAVGRLSGGVLYKGIVQHGFFTPDWNPDFDEWVVTSQDASKNSISSFECAPRLVFTRIDVECITSSEWYCTVD
jgi:hypothetical protein